MVQTLQLSVTPGNAMATVNLSWAGCQPNGILEYLIFYYQVGSVRVKSVSTTSLSTVITGLTNGVQINFRATAFLGGYSSGTQLTETSMVQVVCCTQPDAPADLVAVTSMYYNIINREIQLSWTASYSNASHPVLYYNIYMSSTDGSVVIQTPDATPSYNISSLIDGEEYTISVSGVNLVGEGAQCESVTAIPRGLAGPPTDLVIHYDPDAPNSASPGYQSVDLSFNAPADNGGIDILNYTILYSLDPSFINNVTSVNIIGTEAAVQDANLVIPYADRMTSTGWFYFKVCANNEIGGGPFTSAVTLVADVIPNAVTSLAATNLDGSGNHAPNTVTLSWNYAVDNSTPLLGYIVAYLDMGGEMVSVYVNDVTGSPSHTITGLENGTPYDFSVFSINMLGAGPSLNVSATPSTVPDPPIVSIDHSDRALQLSWSDPYDEGNEITGYNIYRAHLAYGSFDLIASVDGSATSYNDNTNLVNGDIYKYEIAAINDNGEGDRSITVQEYPSKVPSAPSSITLTNSNGSGSGEQLTVAWVEAPADPTHNGGSTIIQYNIRDVNGNLLGSVMAGAGSSYSYDVTDLINGYFYSFRVSAENRDGEGSYVSSPSEHPSGVPDAPSGFSVTDSGSGNSVNLSFDAVSIAAGGTNDHPSNEGLAVTRYNIYVDGVVTHALLHGITSTFYGSLINGQSYSFAISAVNANGEGPQCAAISVVPSTIPDVVTGLAAEHGDHRAGLSWDRLQIAPAEAASDEGSAIQSYTVEMRNVSQGTPFAYLADVNANLSTYMATGLTNGDHYEFRIKATNANGTSTPSDAVGVVPSTTPSAVRNVHIVGNASELQIIWDAPNNDTSGHPSGGLAYKYSLEVSDQNGGVAYGANELTTRYVEVQNLNTNVQYTVSIFAYNEVDDTGLHIYSTQATTVPTPVEITSLSWDSPQPGSLMRWNYASDTFAAIDFLLVVMDVTTGVFSSVFCPAFNAIADETIESNEDGTYSYSYALTHSNTETLSFAPTDILKVMVFARNADGISPMSNVVQVR